jgi:hypothetical protein
MWNPHAPICARPSSSIWKLGVLPMAGPNCRAYPASALPNFLNFCNSAFDGLRVFVEPIEIGFQTSDDGQGDEFRVFVAVEAFYFPFEAAYFSRRGFD